MSRIDMRNLLGFVNQNEWVSNLNIGNIMQISSLCVNELLTFTHNEVELTRDLILEKVWVNNKIDLVVGGVLFLCIDWN